MSLAASLGLAGPLGVIFAAPVVPAASAGFRAAVTTVRDGAGTASRPSARGEGARTTTATPAADRKANPHADASLVKLKVPTTANATNAPRATTGRLRPEPVKPADGPVIVDQLSAPSTAGFGMVGVTWKPGFPEKDLRIQVQTLAGGTWSAWSDLEIDHDSGPVSSDSGAEADVRAGTEPTWVNQADGVHVRIWSDNGTSPEDVQVSLIDGGTGLTLPAAAPAPAAQPAATTAQDTAFSATGAVTPVADTTGSADPTTMDGSSPTTDGTTTDGTTTDGTTDGTTTDPATTGTTTTDTTTTGTTTSTATTTGVPPRPAIVTRKQWGVDTSTEVSCDTPNTEPDMRGIVLHHTVNANDYTEAEAPGIVRAIHLYHTKSRGWCDIGYNFLVDKYGTIYQGRRGGILKQVRGAHAGNMDVNSWTTGISMIGNFDKAVPPPALKAAVVKLMAWRLGLFGHGRASDYISIDGHKMPRIQGHRDVYASGIRPATATACPGKYAYAWLNTSLRGEVQKAIDAAAAGVSTEPVQPAPAPAPAPAPKPSGPTVTRLAGVNRYDTAAKIAQTKFSGPVPAVFLANGDKFPDALSAGPAAASMHAPMLLTSGDRLPPETVSALQQLRPQTIYVLGDEMSISSAVTDQLSLYTPNVSRLAGKNRLATAIRVARAAWTTSDTVYVASAGTFPDALSGGALAAHDRAPILLSYPAHLRAGVVQQIVKLAPSHVVLLGGLPSLSSAVAEQLVAALPSATVSRLAGADRYGTSAQIAQAGWASAKTGYLVQGDDFADALAGVPAAAMADAPLLLTKTACMPSVAFSEVSKLGLQTRILLGGPERVADTAATTSCSP